MAFFEIYRSPSRVISCRSVVLMDEKNCFYGSLMQALPGPYNVAPVRADSIHHFRFAIVPHNPRYARDVKDVFVVNSSSGVVLVARTIPKRISQDANRKGEESLGKLYDFLAARFVWLMNERCWSQRRGFLSNLLRSEQVDIIIFACQRHLIFLLLL